MKRSVAVTRPARISLEHRQLAIASADAKMTVPIEDLGILVLDHNAIDCTAPVLAALAEAGVVTVVANEKHLPCAYIVPMAGHTLMPQTLRGQFQTKVPVKKQLWKQMIEAKIRGQAQVLAMFGRNGEVLTDMAKQVASGDRTNREAAAASLYFGELFQRPFVRLRREEPMPEPEDELLAIANAMLNYGYAVLRSAVARAIILAGLNPTLGIFHRHRENAFALADDVMEPLRPTIDRIVVYNVMQMDRCPTDLTPELKRSLVAALTLEVGWNGGRWPLDAALEAYAAGVRTCLLTNTIKLEIPTV